MERFDFCRCGECGADLNAGEIPVENLHMYGGEATCPYGCGRARHFSRLMGEYSWDRDRTVAWMCPDCGHREVRS